MNATQRTVWYQLALFAAILLAAFLGPMLAFYVSHHGTEWVTTMTERYESYRNSNALLSAATKTKFTEQLASDTERQMWRALAEKSRAVPNTGFVEGQYGVPLVTHIPADPLSRSSVVYAAVVGTMKHDGTVVPTFALYLMHHSGAAYRITSFNSPFMYRYMGGTGNWLLTRNDQLAGLVSDEIYQAYMESGLNK